MLTKDLLKNVIISQEENLNNKKSGLMRDMLAQIKTSSNHTIIISGLRRCGKSTLMRQIINKTKNYNYLNFEDTKITGFDVNDFEKLDDVYKDINHDAHVYFFDEIQVIEHWELFVRTLLDNDNNVIITGSNASMLSKELGTKLTGRHLRYELFPFSYAERLKFLNKESSVESLKDYLLEGGMPEYLLSKDKQMLQELLNDIITRDIIVRYKLRNNKLIKELTEYLLTNVGKEVTYNELTKTFNVGSINTIIKLIGYLEDSYLLFTVPKFSYSLKKQTVNAKKIFGVDTGLIKANSKSFTDDFGRLLENAIFIDLKRRGFEIYYHREKYECDFIVKDKNKELTAMQVCYELHKDNLDRELHGLIDAMESHKIKNGVIITCNQEDFFVKNGYTLRAIPAWKWLTNS